MREKLNNNGAHKETSDLSGELRRVRRNGVG